MSAAVIGLIGTVASVAGSLISANAQSKMVEEQMQQQKRAENARQQQMQMEAQHRRRQTVREAVMARAMSLAVGTASGAEHGTGVAGAMGQATAMGHEGQQAITGAEILGGRVFDANRAYADATIRGQRGMSMGAGISALGGALVQNAGVISRVGSHFAGAMGRNAPQQDPFGGGLVRGPFPSRPSPTRNVPYYMQSPYGL